MSPAPRLPGRWKRFRAFPGQGGGEAAGANAPGTSIARSEEPEQARPRRSSRPIILLAEDDKDMRELLAWTLADGGYDLDAIPDGTLLRLRLTEHLADPEFHRIDLVVSDIELPGATALEVIRGLGGPDRLPPFILITAFGDEVIHRRADEMGVLLMDKPFEMDDLMKHVREILGA